jgi:hypothetical protein
MDESIYGNEENKMKWTKSFENGKNEPMPEWNFTYDMFEKSNSSS